MKRLNVRKGLSCILAVHLLGFSLTACGSDGGAGEPGSAAQDASGSLAQSAERSDSAADTVTGGTDGTAADESGGGQPGIMSDPAYHPGDRQVLTVGVTLPMQELLDLVLAFNESNPSYFIEVQSYYTGLDADAARNLDIQLSQDILSGEGPDLMIWNRSFYTPALVSEKLMLDLNELMDADPDFHREDYLENILEAFETDGRLYLFPASFAVYTTCGKAEELGAGRGITESWGFGEMLDAYENSPHAEMFSSIPNKEYTLDDICRGCMDNFVDWSSGECRFDTPDFVRLLELSNTFPEGFDNVPDSFQEAYSSGRIFLSNHFSLCEPWSMADMRADFGDASLRWPGNPVPNGEEGLGGGVANPWGECFSICKNSSDKEAAWEVIKSLIILTTDEQKETWGNPILRSAFEEKIQDALTIEYETVNGAEQEKIRYEIVLSERGDTMGFSCITEEEANLYRSMIENTHRSFASDMIMMEMILEEAGVYFEGGKDATAAADSIQERVSAYVSEHRN